MTGCRTDFIRKRKGIYYMKKAIHWLDEYLEEFLMVVFLIAMTLIMGIQVFSIYFGSITFMVGRDHKISVYLVGIFKCQFMYEEMHIN